MANPRHLALRLNPIHPINRLYELSTRRKQPAKVRELISGQIVKLWPIAESCYAKALCVPLQVFTELLKAFDDQVVGPGAFELDVLPFEETKGVKDHDYRWRIRAFC